MHDNVSAPHPPPTSTLRVDAHARPIWFCQCRLLLQIVSARNVPVRTSEEGVGGGGLATLPTSGRQLLQQQQSGGLDNDRMGNPLLNGEDYEVG